MSEPDAPFGGVPDQTADPVVWDPAQRRFVPESERVPGGLPASPLARGVVDAKGPDPRRFRIPSSAVGRALPPQPGTPRPPTQEAAGAAAGAASASVAAPPPAATQIATPTIAPPAPPRTPSPPKPTLPRPRRAAPEPVVPAKRGKDPATTRRGKPRRFLPHRPKLRRLIFLMPIIVPLLVIALLAAGLLYANAKFNEVHRVPVGAALSTGGSGTNILLVGSDSRDLQGISSDASGIFGDASNRAPAGQRSDTVMVLRLDSSGAHTLSIPRDLIVTLADTGKRDRINSAYNTDLGGGPVRLIETVKQNLNIPINRYMEVDFATFAGVVDSLGGINIDFPHPAFDDNTGLNVTQTGSVHLNGEQALAYVRSRHYTEVLDNGQKREDPTADLGRIKRQQAFLTAVFGKIGTSRNPITLLRVGTEVVKGLRVDDKLGFWDAVRLGWDLKGMHPESIELPVQPNRDNATLHLAPNVEDALTRFR